MRSSDNKEDITACFVEDVKGGCLIEADCQCKQQHIVGFCNDIPLTCQQCSKEIVYRPWCEW